MENKILVVDLESCGFMQKGGSIVEVGAVSLDLETGEITGIIVTGKQIGRAHV